MAAMLCLAATMAACEPASLTEARDQLGRGGERVVEYVLPIVTDSAKVQDLVDTTETALDTLGGVLALRADPESLSVGVGDELTYQDVDFDTFVVDLIVPPGIGPGYMIPFSSSFDVLASDTVLDAVDTVVVYSGTLVVTTQNRLPATAGYTVTLDGFLDAAGSPLAASGTVPAAPGDGSYVSDVLNFDLAGVTIIPAAAIAQLNGTATVVTSPVDPALGTAAVVQDGSISAIEIQSLAGSLDPAQTPELVIGVEEAREILRSDVDFGDLEEAVEASTINDAVVALEIDNSASAPAVLSDFTLGVVRLDAFGDILRDAFGDPDYEVDSLGQPIVIPVTDPGVPTLTLARSSASNVSLQSAPLATRLFHLLLADERVSLVAAGTIAVGDGAPSRIERTDALAVVLGVIVAFDLTIPDTGVQITRHSVNNGLGDLVEDEREADSLVARIDSVEFTAELVNRTPFGTEIDIAFVRDSLPEGVDVFLLPGAVTIDRVTLSAPPVDAQGRVSQAISDTVVVRLSNTEVRELLNEFFTAQARIRLLPGTGGGGRGAIQASDAVLINSRVRVLLHAGKSQ
ncbi:MAG: hypothetical protein AMS18_05475 [Gemmatimonas sp. SG8_17]|nr:MAG: hypothetical protein AMS18_05475 [Gemmatimonas sp. SG8_17]